MHISRILLVNYRNFPNAKLLFKPGINTIIGENGSGKTNLFNGTLLWSIQNRTRSMGIVSRRVISPYTKSPCHRTDTRSANSLRPRGCFTIYRPILRSGSAAVGSTA